MQGFDLLTISFSVSPSVHTASPSDTLVGCKSSSLAIEHNTPCTLHYMASGLVIYNLILRSKNLAAC